MADLATLEAALVKADAAGDADAARAFAGEIRRLRTPMQKLPTMRESLREELATRGTGEKMLAGVGTAVDNAAMRLKQLVTGKLTPQETANVEANRMMTDESGAALAGNIGGGLAMTAVPGAAVYRGASALAGRALPAALAPTAGGAATGAITAAALEPVLNGESTAGNMAMGAAGGALGDTAARAIGRVAHPIMQSQPVRTLMGEGIVPTPGQAAGANSIWSRIEQRLQSVPIVGDIVTHGRNRATGEFNQAAINRALPAGAPRAGGIGRGEIEQTDNILSQGYTDVLDQIGNVPVSPRFMQAAAAAIRDPDLALPQPVQQELTGIIQQQILARGANNAMTGQLAKRADSNLGMLAREYSASADADQRMLARGIRAVQQAWRQNITDSAPPGVAAELRELDRAFANFVRVERAAGAVGSREGVFSPAQLQSAVRASDRSSRRGQFAQGRALMQDLTDAGTSTLSQTVPNSGTVDRGLMAALLGGGAAGANEYFGGPGFLSALALSPLIYSRAGSRYMLGDLIPGQQAAGALARQAAPYAAPTGALAALLQRRETQ